MQFHERSHVEVEDLAIQAAQVAVVEALGDQEHRIGPVGPRLEHLIPIDDELLAEHRQRHGHPGGLEIDKAAAKVPGIGEHRKRGGPGGGIAAHHVLDRRPRPDLPRRRALPLELSDQPDRPGPRHRRKEVARHGRGREPALERRGRHPLALERHLPPLPLDDLLENRLHGSHDTKPGPGIDSPAALTCPGRLGCSRRTGFGLSLPQLMRAGSGSPRTVSPDARLRPPGYGSLGFACAAPSLAALVKYAVSTVGDNPDPPELVGA